MKHRFALPVSAPSTIAKKTSIVAMVVVMAASIPFQISPVAHADKYDEQIASIQKEIDGYQNQAAQLGQQADSLQKELDGLNAQEKIIQAQIDLNQAQSDKIAAQIEKTQVDIKNNQDALGDTIADIYVDDTISPLEMLASSKSIADYIDKQTYQSAVQTQLNTQIGQVRTLRKSLQAQQKEIQKVIGQQQLAKNALTDTAQQKQQVISQTRGQASAYQQLVSSREQQKLAVQQKQQEAIEAAIRAAGNGSGPTILPGDPNKGGYPWESGCWVDANVMSHGGPNGNGTDLLGYGCRQCVSYVAYKVGAYLNNGWFPRYWGNANMWPGSARKLGIPTGSTPREHAVGVISAGDYGHVVWVEKDNHDGTIDVSQYNYYNAGGPAWGNYSKMRVPASTYDTYIYF